MRLYPYTFANDHKIAIRCNSYPDFQIEQIKLKLYLSGIEKDTQKNWTRNGTLLFQFPVDCCSDY